MVSVGGNAGELFPLVGPSCNEKKKKVTDTRISAPGPWGENGIGES